MVAGVQGQAHVAALYVCDREDVLLGRRSRHRRHRHQMENPSEKRKENRKINKKLK